MKSFALFLLSLFSAITAFAQSDAYLSKIADQGCSCLKNKDVSGMDMETIQQEMSMCLMQSIMTDMENFATEFNVDMTDQTAMQKVGEKIGMKMASRCPDVMMKMAMVEGGPATTPKTGDSLTGTLQSISGKDAATVTIQQPDGSTTKLLWLEAFAGDSKLISGKAVGSTITVKFETRQIWSPTANQYIPRKVLTGVQ